MVGKGDDVRVDDAEAADAEAADAGGDAACWAHLVCEVCGRVREDGVEHGCHQHEAAGVTTFATDRAANEDPGSSR